MNLKDKLRPFKSDDLDFILNTWANNQSSISPFNKIRKGEFIRIFKKIIQNKLPDLEIIVSCNEEYEDQIYGFIVYSKDHESYTSKRVANYFPYSCIHFLFVKNIYRCNGIGSKLLSIVDVPTYYSCLTTNLHARKFISKHKINFNPFLFILNEGAIREHLSNKKM